MFVRLWMTRDPVTISPETPVSEALVRMKQGGFRRFPVLRAGSLVGFLDHQDLERVPAARHREAVEFHMAKDIVSIGPYAPLEEAVRLLREHRIGALPVLQKGRLVGVLTESDVYEAFDAVLAAEVEAACVTFDGLEHPRLLRRAVLLCEKFDLEVLSFVHHRRGADPGRRLFSLRLRGALVETFVEELWKQDFRVLQALVPKSMQGPAGTAEVVPDELRVVLECEAPARTLPWISEKLTSCGLTLLSLNLRTHPDRAGRGLISVHALGTEVERFLRALETKGLQIHKRQLVSRCETGKGPQGSP